MSCGFGPDTGKFRVFSNIFRSDTFIFSNFDNSKFIVSAKLDNGLAGIVEDMDEAGDICACCR